MSELVRQFPLGVDGLENSLLAFGEVAQVSHAVADDAQPVFIQCAGPVFPVPCDEGRGVAFVQKLDSRLDLDLAELKVLSNPGQVERWRVGNVRHGAGHYRGPNAHRAGEDKQTRFDSGIMILPSGKRGQKERERTELMDGG